MHTLWLVIQREFVSNVLTSRFMIGFIVCLLSTAVAVFVQVDDYEKRLSGYNTAVREAEAEAQEWDLYVDIKPKAHRKPNPLSIFNVGAENDGANTVTVELGKPIFEFISTIWEAPTQKRGSDNPFLAMFLTVDVVFYLQNCAQRVSDSVRLQYHFGRERRRHAEVGVIQFDTKRYSRFGKISRRDAVIVPNRFGEFNRGTANCCLFSSYRL